MNTPPISRCLIAHGPFSWSADYRSRSTSLPLRAIASYAIIRSPIAQGSTFAASAAKIDGLDQRGSRMAANHPYRLATPPPAPAACRAASLCRLPCNRRRPTAPPPPPPATAQHRRLPPLPRRLPCRPPLPMPAPNRPAHCTVPPQRYCGGITFPVPMTLCPLCQDARDLVCVTQAPPTLLLATQAGSCRPSLVTVTPLRPCGPLGRVLDPPPRT